MADLRDRMITIRMTAEEVAMLQAVAKRDGLSVSDYVRSHARRVYRDAFGEKPAKKK